MADFFINYGLFTLKVITLVLAFVGVVLFIVAIAASKKDNDDTIEIENLNEKFDDMEEALNSELLSKEELKALEKERKKKEKLEAKEEKKKAKEGVETTKHKIFVLRFDGDIEASETNSIRESITAILTVANENDEVLVVLESPGGIVQNYGLAASQLSRIKKKNIKLTIAVDLVAASGGYLMACVADKIIAAPFAVVGSIGVLAEVPNFHKLLTKYDIDIEHHTAGDYKTTLSTLAKNTDKGRKKFIEELEETHALFKSFVKENRPSLDIDKLATGETWYAAQALENKLVDELITSDDYLLDKKDDFDIYEIKYCAKETFSDKLRNAMHGAIKDSILTIWSKFGTAKGMTKI